MSIRTFVDRHLNEYKVFTWNNVATNDIIGGEKEDLELQSFLPEGSICNKVDDFDYFSIHPELGIRGNVSRDIFPKKLEITNKGNAMVVHIGESVICDPNSDLKIISEEELDKFYDPVERSEP
jgi:hypothetical protein